jgi:hypothetical protein
MRNFAIAFVLGGLGLLVSGRAVHAEAAPSSLVVNSVSPTSSSSPSASTPAPLAASHIIPADRTFAWNPGLMSKGGIDIRTGICASLSPAVQVAPFRA